MSFNFTISPKIINPSSCMQISVSLESSRKCSNTKSLLTNKEARLAVIKLIEQNKIDEALEVLKENPKVKLGYEHIKKLAKISDEFSVGSVVALDSNGRLIPANAKTGVPVGIVQSVNPKTSKAVIMTHGMIEL